jgi:hypothetical protein
VELAVLFLLMFNSKIIASMYDNDS